MFIPTTADEVRSLGWERLDVILVSGDTYIDTPCDGAAIIGRVLTFLYFAFFITMPLWTKLDKTKPVPERVTTHD